jgi:hypothetical protein
MTSARKELGAFGLVPMFCPVFCYCFAKMAGYPKTLRNSVKMNRSEQNALNNSSTSAENRLVAD